MIRLRTLRRVFTVTALAVVVTAATADDLPKTKSPPDPKAKKKDEKKMTPPPLDAKEWKKLGDNGLEVWDVKEGTGDPVKKSATVTIHYTGWLTDGTVFDSSKKKGVMATFPLDNLIKGWQEGIPGMKPGGTRRLKIPYELAYGAAGRPPLIPAKATLLFEIELARGKPKFPDLKAKEWKPLGDGSTGIRIWDEVEGDGEVVKPGADVKIHYTGWTTAGKQFDSSYDSPGGKPADFPLTSLIKGWQLAVPGMKVGGVRRMELPYQYAYGERGMPPDIGPRATLVFEIEVLGTK